MTNSYPGTEPPTDEIRAKIKEWRVIYNRRVQRARRIAKRKGWLLRNKGTMGLDWWIIYDEKQQRDLFEAEVPRLFPLERTLARVEERLGIIITEEETLGYEKGEKLGCEKEERSE